MRISSSGSVLRSDLRPARALIPALWAEWRAFTFDADGWLRDPDTGASLPVLRLTSGRHRVPGAVYRLDTGPTRDPVTRELHPTAVDVTLLADDGRRLQVRVGRDFWQIDVDLADTPTADGGVDTAAALRANKVPGCLVALIGGARATGQARLDPSRLDPPLLHAGGDLLTVRAQAQRVRAEITAAVDPKRERWDGAVTIRLHGRGLIGRLVLLAAGRPIRRNVEKSLVDLWKDLDEQAQQLHRSLASLDAEVRDGGGGEQAWLHRELWKGLREPPETPA